MHMYSVQGLFHSRCGCFAGTHLGTMCTVPSKARSENWNLMEFQVLMSCCVGSLKPGPSARAANSPATLK